jgi:hypothetical protein
VFAISTLSGAPARRVAADLPAQLSDKEFWQLSKDLSEPPGYFRSENLVSNETMFQWVIPELTKTVAPGGVYLGVAPDQNFTYIVALRPKMAFIVDIRRGNVLEHLLYKALIEMSADRADFLSRLFSRQRPSGLSTTSTADQLVIAYDRVAASPSLFQANQTTVLDLLEKKHGFTMSRGDEDGLRWVYQAFYSEGPELTYAYSGSNAGRGFGRGMGPGMFATYGDLQAQTDAAGVNHAYLGSESNYLWLKAFEAKNLLVPMNGDFAGPKALRAVGQYVKDHGATVTAFYTSNVEQYLFQQGDDWSRFYSNVAALPLDSSSRFIRSVPNSMTSPAQPGARAASMLCPMALLVKTFLDGNIHGYYDVVAMSR